MPLRTPLRLVALSVLLIALGCDDITAPSAGGPVLETRGLEGVRLSLDTLETGLDEPIFVTHAPGEPRNLYIVEKSGRVWIRHLDQGNRPLQLFLDVSGNVSRGSEQGLLGLAFHPRYPATRRLFLNYTDRLGDTRVVEYRGAVGAARADSVGEILFVDQPGSLHNGGMMAFGADGYLYIALGDGGGGQRGNGQRLHTLLGKILRIDVDGAAPYEVPATNPFVGVDSARAEIWHLGLRNPWRFSFDRKNGRMWIADVGQDVYEEINISNRSERGLNFGWPRMEGPDCFNRESCNQTGFELPLHWYTHDVGCAITGGYVYRGGLMARLRGEYFFADFCSGVIQSLRLRDGPAVTITDWTSHLGVVPLITSFGEDHQGELYVTTLDGLVLRIRKGLPGRRPIGSGSPD